MPVYSRLLVRNGLDWPLLFIFEPWCWTYELAPDEELVCVAEGIRDGFLTAEYTADSITVYGWDTSTAKVVARDGSTLVSLDLAVPDFVGMDEQAHTNRKTP